MKVFFDLFQEIASKYALKMTNSVDGVGDADLLRRFIDVIDFLGQIDREVCYYIFNMKTMQHEYISKHSLFFLDQIDLSFYTYFEAIHPSDRMLYAAILSEALQLSDRYPYQEKKQMLMEYSLRVKMQDHYVYVDESLRPLLFDNQGEAYVIVGTIRLSRQNKSKPPYFYNFETKQYFPLFKDDNKYSLLLGMDEAFSQKEMTLILIFTKYPKHTQQQIAEMLDVHVNTIKNHIKNIKKKSNLTTIDEIVNISFILGWGYEEPNLAVFAKE